MCAFATYNIHFTSLIPFLWFPFKVNVLTIPKLVLESTYNYNYIITAYKHQACINSLMVFFFKNTLLANSYCVINCYLCVLMGPLMVKTQTVKNKHQHNISIITLTQPSSAGDGVVMRYSFVPVVVLAPFLIVVM